MCKTSFSRILFFTAALGCHLLLRGGNTCATATVLTVSPAAAAYTCTTPSAFTFATTPCTSSAGLPGGCAATCSREMWFRYDPADASFPTQQHSLRIELSLNFTAAATSVVKYYVLYSEAKDNGFGNPCTWVNTFTPDFIPWTSGCVTVAGGTTGQQTILVEGLDGSGTFFLKLERATGNGGTVTVCTKQLNAPANPPANDRCANATALTSGAGIDPLAAAGGTASWAAALAGSNKNATKQRRTDECPAVTPTEDHFATNLNGQCKSNWHIGDVINTAVVGGALTPPRVFRHVNNTVYFTFNRPAADPAAGWYLHVGNMDCHNSAGDSLEILIVENLDCADAAQTLRLAQAGAFASVLASGTYPDPDLTLGPFVFAASTTYGIVIDGVSGSGCDFSLMLSRNAVMNPVLGLPVIPQPDAPAELAFEIRGLYPQPAGDFATLDLEMPEDGTLNLRLTDMGGKTVMERDLDLAAGAQQVRIETAHLPAGIYLLRSGWNGRVLYRKLMR